ncbi:MAG: methyltransferase domain-containing protein [Novosphingobium sp.]|nr:methyltransferase domain-containing protein [Novosphingobium sp.]
MNEFHRSRIGRAFAAARDYDHYARVQHEVARSLAGRILAYRLPISPRVLEIGCGTGFLTESLADRGLGGDWLVTDLSSAMVERTRHRLSSITHEHRHLRFAEFDGEYDVPPGMGQFDLVCSSLAMQWFDDLEGAIGRMLDWLQPGGLLAFTTLASGTFAEWRKAHADEGLIAGTPEYPSVAELATMVPQHQAAPHEVEMHVERHACARSYLRALKAIGACTAACDHQPLPAGAMRRVMRRFEEGGCKATYEVVTCFYRRAA